jgi:hypothetical protein
MDDQDLATARTGVRRTTVVWLSTAGVAVLAVGIVIGSQWDSAPTSPPIAERTTTTSVTVLPVAEPSPEVSDPVAGPGSIWLADLPPVGTSSLDDSYVGGPWTTTSARVGENNYPKAVSATGAWCSRAQVTFALDGKFERFTAKVAIARNSLETKGLDFYVLADDQRVAEIPNVGLAPWPVDLVVTGARLLTIGVEPPAGDRSDCPGPERVGVWANPVLTVAGATPPTG